MGKRLAKNSFSNTMKFDNAKIIVDSPYLFKGPSSSKILHTPDTSFNFDNSRGNMKNVNVIGKAILSIGFEDYIAFITSREGQIYIPYLKALNAKIFIFDYENMVFQLRPDGIYYKQGFDSFTYIPNIRAMILNMVKKGAVNYSTSLLEEIESDKVYYSKQFGGKIVDMFGSKEPKWYNAESGKYFSVLNSIIFNDNSIVFNTYLQFWDKIVKFRTDLHAFDSAYNFENKLSTIVDQSFALFPREIHIEIYDLLIKIINRVVTQIG